MPLQTPEDRQGFLGPAFDRARSSLRLGIVGVSGGGSHLAQQAAHLGFENYVLIDPKWIDNQHLHRFVGAKADDVAKKRPKVHIALRVIQSVQPNANILPLIGRWQDHAPTLRSCDVVLGAIDGFAPRRELELFSRRYLIPYIDIGMRVAPPIDRDPPRMVGQVFLSHPGGPCFSCLGIVTDRHVGEEAQRYGDHAVEQQVVYANGVLASAAIGLLLDVVSRWSKSSPPIFLQFDGNNLSLSRAVQLDHVKRCSHFSSLDVGDPVALQH